MSESGALFHSAANTTSADENCVRPKTSRRSLHSLRDRAAAFAGVAGSTLQHALVTEYPPGATIGWHKDKAVFGKVIGISLLSDCTFRFRRKSGSGWERRSLTTKARSIYLLQGPARNEWEHSIPLVQSLRYSITFRELPAARSIGQ